MSVSSTPPSRLRTILRWAGIAAWILVFLGFTAWSALAIWFARDLPEWMRFPLLGLLLLGCGWAAWRGGWTRRLLVPAAFWTATVAWFLISPASNDRNWLPEVRVVPRIAIDGDRMVVEGLRAFRYRTLEDFDERWERREYDLSKLETLDLFKSFWGPELVSHTFVSFGFRRDDGSMDHLCISIEARRQVGDSFDALASLFRKFELIFVFGDELDIVRLRTNVRGEDVLRYRIVTQGDGMRRLLEAYVAQANELADRAQWYNAITRNCGVEIIRLAWGSDMPRIPRLRTLANGLWDRVAYEDGAFGTELTFEELRARARINEAAADSPPDDPHFSERIRAVDVEKRLNRPIE